ncbi:class I SAM-dependent methyltransferase [Pimelobacter simplex]|uniref:class I SAM-dependent methyltransferase n=1 Tax=Nocardioides simplex TaxID=2045 RepID=UPI0019315F1E|nr:class I SAM-dependent methyltransferase [Pimelobacter simplex]
MSTTVAEDLASALRPFVGGELPVRLIAWDGTTAGPVGAPVVELRSPDALRRLLWHPGELGAAQAYVTGELDVPGDLDAALTHAFAVASDRDLPSRPSLRALAGAVRTAVGLDLLGRPPAAPATQARVRGRLHSKDRDRRAISHHYDTTADFYSLVLDERTMAYSCGYHSSPEQPLAEAQEAKLDLVCRKLGLEPGMRLLDVGCGWGSLSLHAAEHHGARVVGVTISAEQRRFAEAAARRRGVADRVEIRLCDYRDAVPLPGAEFDAVASLEMGEHVGERNYPTYARVLHDAVRPGGRVLVQQMSRGANHPGGGPFIESFIAPDMHMRPVGATIGLLEAAGLELRGVEALREHYVLTVAGWLARFEENIEAITALVGEELVRVWRLYLVGGSMAFRDGRMGVDQLLLRRPVG